jgi:hypothetical protein
MEKVYLIIDSDNLLGRSIIEQLLQDGCTVIGHTRTIYSEYQSANPKFHHVHASNISQSLADWELTYGSFTGVVFNALDDNEDELFDVEQIDVFANYLESSLNTYLSELQAVSGNLIRGEGGQVWVLTYDDSFQYYVSVPCSPVASRARISAVKTVAKEVARFSVKVNAAVIQAPLEVLPIQKWKEAKQRLKTLSAKYKPMPADSIASLFSGLLQNSNLPLIGLTINVGTGVIENNI